jgi:transcriptional regulator with XRE-family HTH domain
MTRPKNKDESILKAVGERLQKLRIQKGMTQEQLAEAIGVQPETVSRYERGAIPLSLSQLFQISEALGVGVDLLLGLPAKKGQESRREAELFERFSLLDKLGQDLILALLRRLG